jgi:hypothetical protein
MNRRVIESRTLRETNTYQDIAYLVEYQGGYGIQVQRHSKRTGKAVTGSYDRIASGLTDESLRSAREAFNQRHP